MGKKGTEQAGAATEWTKGNWQCNIFLICTSICGLSPDHIIGGKAETQTASYKLTLKKCSIGKRKYCL